MRNLITKTGAAPAARVALNAVPEGTAAKIYADLDAMEKALEHGRREAEFDRERAQELRVRRLPEPTDRSGGEKDYGPNLGR